MRSFLVLLFVLFIALGHALPTRSLSRQKRGFRINSSNRVAHGYGKRQSSSWDHGVTVTSPSGGLMTVQELVKLSAENPSLLEALIEKFIDTDGDGIVSTQELFGLAMSQ